ncbi:MAG TPA: hypothetical protein PLF35_10010 [Prolixibacteraceae bacterium]|nr:hypothetical protein [Prolixibacteraceae bacterium]
MINKTKNTVKQVFAFIFVGLVIFQLAGQSVFLHAHILPNGTVITHTHPFDKSSDQQPFKTHHHKHSDLIIIDQANVFFLQNSPIEIDYLQSNSSQLLCYVNNNYHFSNFIFFCNKAPPVGVNS